MRILVAEDDVRLAALLEESLTDAEWHRHPCW
jgi:DNA-binding response OmpR family regulator